MSFHIYDTDQVKSAESKIRSRCSLINGPTDYAMNSHGFGGSRHSRGKFYTLEISRCSLINGPTDYAMNSHGFGGSRHSRGKFYTLEM
ncbi:hypothetical protein J6590_022905 [Homalodisca vitripennis]|nr:hypothetical protein J6590_022905 [Homalodisca vitripennis]